MNRKPQWLDAPRPQSFDDLVYSIGHEGIERLFVGKVMKEVNRATDFAEENGLANSQAIKIDSFICDAILEAATVGLRLGYGLAIARPDFGSFGNWLTAAIRAVQLTDYTPNVRFEGE